MAFQLFLEEKERLSLRDLRTVIEKILKAQSPLARDLKEKPAAELVRELEDDGLLIKAGAGDNPPYLFLHLTFQEYLAACALARRARMVELDGEEVPEWFKFIKENIGSIPWSEVVSLMANLIPDARDRERVAMLLFNAAKDLHRECPAAVRSMVHWAIGSPRAEKMLSDLIMLILGQPELIDVDGKQRITWSITVSDLGDRWLQKIVEAGKKAIICGAPLITELAKSDISALRFPDGEIDVDEFLFYCLWHTERVVREAAWKALSVRAPSWLVDFALHVVRQYIGGKPTADDLFGALKVLEELAPTISDPARVRQSMYELARTTIDAFAYYQALRVLASIGGIQSAIYLAKILRGERTQRRDVVEALLDCELLLPEHAVQILTRQDLLRWEKIFLATVIYVVHGFDNSQGSSFRDEVEKAANGEKENYIKALELLEEAKSLVVTTPRYQRIAEDFDKVCKLLRCAAQQALE